jgi:hypothetical protein
LSSSDYWTLVGRSGGFDSDTREIFCKVTKVKQLVDMFYRQDREFCEDCWRKIPPYLLDRGAIACASYHYAQTICCRKQICKYGCLWQCWNCNEYLKVVDSYDGYYDSILCWSCNSDNPVKVKFSGNLRTECDRYCLCGMGDISYSVNSTHYNKKR